MSWTSLKMISLGSLLLFGGRPLCAGALRCIGKHELERDWPGLNHEQKGDLKNRSISPWTYTLDKNETRHPREIYRAKCVNSGCVINEVETRTYNSVAVTVHMMVWYSRPCAHNPKKYEVTVDWIQVPVACTCVRPKVYSSDK